MEVISVLLDVDQKELEASFSTGITPGAAVDLIRELASAPGQKLIASCFTGRVRIPLQDDRDALQEAVRAGVSVAIFFPFPRRSSSPANPEYAEGLTNQHHEAWRTILEYWNWLRRFSEEQGPPSVRLYRPVVESSNVLFTPQFHRIALFCERNEGVTKIDLYTWTQEEKRDGFYTISGRSLEPTDIQIDRWKLFFGDVLERWNERGDLPEGDSYWKAYSGQSERTDQEA